MREIDFRAWDKQTRDMLELYPSSMEFYNKRLQTYRPFYSKHIIRLQYTGLRDNNGQKVYEGDIVLFDSDYITEKCVICYDVNRAMYKAVPLSMFFPNAGNGSWTGYVLISTYEVLGNIYENPELLEGDEWD